ncbi:MAG: DUF4124 domain-containing protein [Pseudomonadales bacterium]|nr:DUF4124 domain-containing protein [Pseudomonadales bacterium]
MLLLLFKVGLATLIIPFILFGLPSTTKADVYQWEKPDGTTVYSDERGPNSRRVEVKPVSIVNLPVPPTSPAVQPKTVDQGYRLAITSPTHDTTLRDNSGSVSVTASIAPPLKPAHLLQLTLDGSPINKLGTSTAFMLRGVNRGSHHIALQVVNKQGKVIQTSPAITVHVFRRSVLHK